LSDDGKTVGRDEGASVAFGKPVPVAQVNGAVLESRQAIKGLRLLTKFHKVRVGNRPDGPGSCDDRVGEIQDPIAVVEREVLNRNAFTT
jgi:hypothetical protein